MNLIKIEKQVYLYEIKDMCKEISLKIETEVPEDTIIYNTKNAI